ncbi:hypothetical protein MNBD_BACTEROID05-123 [hydrothermal vent metagenome]|uniref:Nucleoside phosphorylase domain-containing protein n=1 Tax=hydrothermal vent metagenome TaxID=652676 RepID=A0A3B0T5W1_9ZZZZ
MSFKNQFGIDAQSIKPTCILTPFLYKGLLEDLEIKSLSKGKPYASGHGKNFTLIHTQVGSLFMGDCVLSLKKTPCKQLIMLGSCGLVEKTDHLDIGQIVLPIQSYEMESFSQMLEKKYINLNAHHANESLMNNLTPSSPFPKVSCASLGSIKQENNYLNFFKKNGIEIVDMEYSAFLTASKHINIPACGILYITDIIGESSPFNLNSSSQQKIKTAQKEMSNILIKL